MERVSVNRCREGKKRREGDREEKRKDKREKKRGAAECRRVVVAREDIRRTQSRNTSISLI